MSMRFNKRMQVIYEINTEYYTFIIKKNGVNNIAIYAIYKPYNIQFKSELITGKYINNKDIIINLIECLTFRKNKYFKIIGRTKYTIKIFFSNNVNGMSTLKFSPIKKKINIDNTCLKLSYIAYKSKFIKLSELNSNTTRIIHSDSKYELNIFNCTELVFDIENINKVSIPMHIYNLVINCKNFNDISLFDFSLFNKKYIYTLHLLNVELDINIDFQNFIIKFIDISQIQKIFITFNLQKQFFEYIYFKNSINLLRNCEIITDIKN